MSPVWVLGLVGTGQGLRATIFSLATPQEASETILYSSLSLLLCRMGYKQEVLKVTSSPGVGDVGALSRVPSPWERVTSPLGSKSSHWEVGSCGVFLGPLQAFALTNSLKGHHVPPARCCGESRDGPAIPRPSSGSPRKMRFKVV